MTDQRAMPGILTYMGAMALVHTPVSLPGSLLFDPCDLEELCGLAPAI